MPTKKQLSQSMESQFEFAQTRREDDPMYKNPAPVKTEEKDKVAELMKPRYKVIADYPLSCLAVGEVIVGVDKYKPVVQGGYWQVDVEQYPHLFKKLEWYEDRTIMDLPDYIKWKSPGQDDVSVFVVKNWYSSPNSFDIAGCDVDAGRLFIKDCLPATKEEYDSYIKLKK